MGIENWRNPLGGQFGKCDKSHRSVHLFCLSKSFLLRILASGNNPELGGNYSHIDIHLGVINKKE